MVICNPQSSFDHQISSVSITNSDTLNVSIVSEPGIYFEGFLLKSVTVSGGKTVGTFKILEVTNGGPEEEKDASSSEESDDSGESDKEPNVQNGKQISAGAKYLKCAGARVWFCISIFNFSHFDVF